MYANLCELMRTHIALHTHLFDNQIIRYFKFMRTCTSLYKINKA